MEPLWTNMFPNADKTAWRTQVQKELKREDAYESLRWQTDEGFLLEPYYTTDSLANLPLDLIQAAQKPTAGWFNAPEYHITGEKATNATLRDAIQQGADALLLNLPASAINVSQLLNGIKLSDTPIFFRPGYNVTNGESHFDPADFVRTLRNVAPYQLKGGLLLDVRNITADLLQLMSDSPQFRTVYISSHTFHNAGATATQELAFTLASLADAYDKLTDSGLTLDQIIPKTILSISVGTGYFLEIAKLRALRVLLVRFCSAYDPSLILNSSSYTILCQTSTFYDAAVTPYTNLIRAATEAMAAIIGGGDVLTVHPYDTVLNRSAESPDRNFAERIARNVSLLLKEESYLDKVADPSAGSYYIEHLTHELVEGAWALFLTIEERGGLAMTGGFVQAEIERAYQAKVEAVRTERVLVGVTKFRSDETASQVSEVVHKKMGLLPDRRLSAEFE